LSWLLFSKHSALQHVPMNGETLIYGLLGALAIALITAAVTDIKRREIENWLNLGIALVAPVYWFAIGMDPWPNMAIQVGVAAIVFLIFMLVFMIGQMGGGDVKLLGALALWFPWTEIIYLIVIMSIAGGVMTLVMVIHHKIKKYEGQPVIPYGVAISFAGLWLLVERYFNHFG